MTSDIAEICTDEGPETLLDAVESFLSTSQVAPSRLGREAMGDPTFVRELRRGRLPRPITAAKVVAYIASSGPKNTGATG